MNELVNEGLHNKLYRMPEDARMKLKETIERIINDGCNGLICIIIKFTKNLDETARFFSRNRAVFSCQKIINAL